MLLLLVLHFSLASSFAASSFTSLRTIRDLSSVEISALSGDGKVVVGKMEVRLSKYTCGPADYIQACRWTAAGGMVGLGYLPGGSRCYAYGVSFDGKVVVGYSDSASLEKPVHKKTGGGSKDYDLDTLHDEAFRWTAQGGMVGLGCLPGGSNSTAHAVSSNGKVIVGGGDSASGWQLFRWTAAGGMVGLGNSNAFATAVCSDGSMIVGWCDTPSGRQSFRWTAAGGFAGLGCLPGYSESYANAVSSDGSVVVGECYSASGKQAFRWTEATGMVGLGILPGYTESYGTAISGDGAIVVGKCSGYTHDKALITGPIPAGEMDSRGFPISVAFIWDSVNGMRNLQTVLTNGYHLRLSGPTGWKLGEAIGISADGKTIVGYGSHEPRPDTWSYEGWIAHLDKPVNQPVKNGPKPGTKGTRRE